MLYIQAQRSDNVYTDLRRSSSGQFAPDLVGETAFHMNIILWSIEQSKCRSSRWLSIYSLQRPHLKFHSITDRCFLVTGHWIV